MNTTAAKLDQYIIDAISTEGYDVEATTDDEKLIFLVNTFYSESRYNVYNGPQEEAFVEWMRGLPSSLDVPFMDFGIEDDMHKLGIAEDGNDIVMKQFYGLIAERVFQMLEERP